MKTLNLMINKREYELSCNDGEEEQLQRLSYELDKRVRELSKGVGTANQSTLLVFAGLQLLDELYEARYSKNKGDVKAEVDKATSSTLNSISNKIEAIAEKLEKKVV